MRKHFALIATAVLVFGSCDKKRDVALETRASRSETELTLVELAIEDSADRITRDIQGNIVEVDLTDLAVSDEFVPSLLDTELKSLQKLTVSGELITPKTISRLLDSDPFPVFREIVFVGTAVPENHIWVAQYQERFPSTKLTFQSVPIE